MSRANSKKEGVRKWYRENAEEHNKARRERYAENEELRLKAQANARAVRESLKQRGGAVVRELYREVNGKHVRVYSTGEVAHRLGCSAQLVRNWDASGDIPPPSFPGKHRVYTYKQVRAMSLLLQKDLSKESVVASIKARWEA